MRFFATWERHRILVLAALLSFCIDAACEAKPRQEDLNILKEGIQLIEAVRQAPPDRRAQFIIAGTVYAGGPACLRIGSDAQPDLIASLLLKDRGDCRVVCADRARQAVLQAPVGRQRELFRERCSMRLGDLDPQLSYPETILVHKALSFLAQAWRRVNEVDPEHPFLRLAGDFNQLIAPLSFPASYRKAAGAYQLPSLDFKDAAVRPRLVDLQPGPFVALTESGVRVGIPLLLGFQDGKIALLGREQGLTVPGRLVGALPKADRDLTDREKAALVEAIRQADRFRRDLSNPLPGFGQPREESNEIVQMVVEEEEEREINDGGKFGREEGKFEVEEKHLRIPRLPPEAFIRVDSSSSGILAELGRGSRPNPLFATERSSSVVKEDPFPSFQENQIVTLIVDEALAWDRVAPVLAALHDAGYRRFQLPVYGHRKGLLIELPTGAHYAQAYHCEDERADSEHLQRVLQIRADSLVFSKGDPVPMDGPLDIDFVVREARRRLAPDKGESVLVEVRAPLPVKGLLALSAAVSLDRDPLWAVPSKRYEHYRRQALPSALPLAMSDIGASGVLLGFKSIGISASGGGGFDRGLFEKVMRRQTSAWARCFSQLAGSREQSATLAFQLEPNGDIHPHEVVLLPANRQVQDCLRDRLAYTELPRFGAGDPVRVRMELFFKEHRIEGTAGYGVRGGGFGLSRGGGGLGRVRHRALPLRGIVGFGLPTINGDMDRATLMRILQNRDNAMRGCYQQALSLKPNLRGKVEVQFKVDPTGRVTRVRVRRTTVRNRRLENCVLLEIKQMLFPATGGTVRITIPLSFRIGGG